VFSSSWAVARKASTERKAVREGVAGGLPDRVAAEAVMTSVSVSTWMRSCSRIVLRRP
jgi:hypothetical protein